MLKFINRIVFEFSPISSSSRSIRSFLHRISTDDQKAANQKCQLIVKMADEFIAPKISIVYSDKTTLELPTSDISSVEIYDDVNRHVKKLKLAQDIKDASS